MEVKYINPFVNSVLNAMETMLGITPDRLPPFLKSANLTHGDVSGIIGFGGKDISGSVVLSFPTETALGVYEKMMGEPASRINSDVQDTIGELTNIVAGGAKKDFSEEGLSFHISIPTVIVGKNHALGHKFDIPAVVVPFRIGKSAFTMEISLKIGNSDPFHKSIGSSNPRTST
jgi:chemotaxis protein CheX